MRGRSGGGDRGEGEGGGAYMTTKGGKAHGANNYGKIKNRILCILCLIAWLKSNEILLESSLNCLQNLSNQDFLGQFV